RALARAVTALAAGLSGPGVYIAIGAVAGDDGYQCGFDDAPICPHETAFIEQLITAAGIDPQAAVGARALLECGATIRDPGSSPPPISPIRTTPQSAPSPAGPSSRSVPRPTTRAAPSWRASRPSSATASTGRATARSSTTRSTSPATPRW